jgi:phosphoribosylamine---glycine ligase
MAAAGYPAAPRAGDAITGLMPASPAGADDSRPADAAKVFHAGTTTRGDAVVTSGGRVLCVTALGDSTRLAQQQAYDALRGIAFAGAQWRSDIGQRAIER